ncbi:major facilitator superfamily protein [Paenibacillus macerans]|nr:sugar (and other) transporter family protein [Paenibacillus macerans]GBK61211.1 MFS transporter [Paenibacillus macerans]GBK67513.1 MFS transporter [Paenibacillus macerans]GIP09140.1 MFS transporter [Paenibacillus macerans]SUA85486.1 major facilitator superfamily protein [Paenibacillus macerans]
MKFFSLDINVKIRLIERFLTQIVANAIQPFMVIYFSYTLGAKLAGVLLAINVILSFISGFYGGYWSDRFGRKRIMILSEIVRFFAVFTMFLESTALFDSAMVVYFAMAINSIASGISGPAGEALIVDSSSSEERKYIYTIDYWLWNLSLLAGSVIGGFFFKEYKHILMLCLTLVSIISIILLVFFIKETIGKTELQPVELKKRFWPQFLLNYKTVSMDRIFLVFLIASLLDLSVQTQTSNFIAVRLVNEISEQKLFSWGNCNFLVDGYNLFGMLNTLNAVIVTVFAALISYLTGKIGPKYAIVAGMLIYTTGYSIISYETRPWILFAMMAVVSLGELIYVPHKQALMADIIPNDKRGSYMAMNAVTTRGAVMLGSLAVTLGAVVPKYVVSLEIFIIGMASIWFFFKLLSTIFPAEISKSKEADANIDL